MDDTDRWSVLGRDSSEADMAVREILQLRNPMLLEKAAPVEDIFVEKVHQTIHDHDDTLTRFREANGYGRGIAIPRSGSSGAAREGLAHRMNKIPSLEILGRTVPLWAVALAFVALGLAAYSPYLGSGFSGDDFTFLSMLEGALPYDPVAGFWYGELHSYPGLGWLWWAEPGSEGAFLRPLASWTLTLLYRTFGRDAVPFHATLMIVHALGAFAAFVLFSRLSGRTRLSLVAAVLFLICEDHGMTVAWVTTITDLLCALFLNLALLCHVIARQKRKPWPFAVSLVFFLAAMASKETAAVYPLIVVAYELFFADRLDYEANPVAHTTRFRLLLRHAWAWAIPLAILAAYMTFYVSLVPPMRNLMYQDPFGQPAEYLAAMMTDLPVMFLGLLTQFLPSIVVLVRETLPFAAGAGAVLMGLLVWALLPHRRERAVWFSLVVFVLGLLPGLAAIPGERLLYFPSVYGLFVVAWLICQIPRFRRALTPDAAPGVRVLGPAWGGYLLASAVIVPVVLLFIYPSVWIAGLRIPERTVLRSLPLIQEADPEHVVYLNTSSSYNTFYLPDIYRYHRSEYIDLRVLSSFNGHVWARQASERVLELRTEDRGWLGNMFARVVRVTPEFAVGDVYTTPLFTATLLAVSQDRRDVQAVRFQFTRPLDDPSLLLLLYYDGRTYRRWEPSPEWALLNHRVDRFGF